MTWYVWAMGEVVVSRSESPTKENLVQDWQIYLNHKYQVYYIKKTPPQHNKNIAAVNLTKKNIFKLW